MATVAESLFGVTPESLQQERQNALMNRAVQLAQLDPFQQAYTSIYAGAGNLGRGIGGLLGAEDPELMRVRQRQELLQGVDPTNPASLRAAAQKAMERKDYQAAQLLADRAVNAETSVAKLEAERALTNQRNRERQAASLPEKVFAALAAKATPASVKAAQDAGNDVSLLQIPENVKVSTYGQVLKDAGFVEGTPEFQSKMKEFAAAELEGTKRGKGTNVYNTVEGIDKAISAVVGKGIGEEVSSLGKNVAGLSKFERAVAEVETLLPNSFTGLGSGALTQLNKAASAIGLSKGEKASNTEILTNTFNNIVLPMARQLPGSLAAKELIFLLTTKPATEQEMPTIRRLIRQMLQDYRDDKLTYDLAQKHASKNKGSYVGFDINSARYNVGRRTDLENRVRAGTASVAEAEELKKLRSEMQ